MDRTPPLCGRAAILRTCGTPTTYGRPRALCLPGRTSCGSCSAAATGFPRAALIASFGSAPRTASEMGYGIGDAGRARVSLASGDDFRTGAGAPYQRAGADRPPTAQTGPGSPATTHRPRARAARVRHTSAARDKRTRTGVGVCSVSMAGGAWCPPTDLETVDATVRRRRPHRAARV